MLISQYKEMYLEWGEACNRLVGKLVWELQISGEMHWKEGVHLTVNNQY
jgi:hypothetical protein